MYFKVSDDSYCYVIDEFHKEKNCKPNTTLFQPISNSLTCLSEFAFKVSRISRTYLALFREFERRSLEMMTNEFRGHQVSEGCTVVYSWSLRLECVLTLICRNDVNVGCFTFTFFCSFLWCIHNGSSQVSLF